MGSPSGAFIYLFTAHPQNMFRNKRASLKTADLVHRLSLRGWTGRQPGCSPESLFSMSAAGSSVVGDDRDRNGVVVASCIAHQKKYRTRVPLRQTESEETKSPALRNTLELSNSRRGGGGDSSSASNLISGYLHLILLWISSGC